MAAAPQQPFADPAPLRVVAFLEPALDRLRELAGLERGWDSYDAEPLAPVALATARGLLMLAAGEIRHQVEASASLHVAPLADGGVQLDWRGPAADLEIEIQADGTLNYLLAPSDRDRDRSHELHTERDGVAVDDILAVIRGVLSDDEASSA